jgi:hypothetical protein
MWEERINTWLQSDRCKEWSFAVIVVGTILYIVWIAIMWPYITWPY